MWVDQEWWMVDRGEPESDNDEAEKSSSDDSDEECPLLPPPDTLYKETWDIGSPELVRQPGWFRCPKECSEVRALHSTSTRPGEGAIYRYLSRQGKIAGDIHETKSSGLFLS